MEHFQRSHPYKSLATVKISSGPVSTEMVDWNTHVDEESSRLVDAGAQRKRHTQRLTQSPYDGLPTDDEHSVQSEGAKPSAQGYSFVAKDGTNPSTYVYWKGAPWYYLVRDVFSVIVSICFLVLGACVVSLDGQPQSLWSDHVIQATKVATSLWPVMFSGLLGNAIRGFADWRVERGESLMALEQLMGSLTMANSFFTVFRWRLFKFMSAALIILWAFNPIGSQASLRGAYLRDSKGYGNGTITYYNHNLTDQMGMTIFNFLGARAKPAVRALYAAALFDTISSIQYVDQSSEAFKELVMKLGGPGAAGVQAAMDPWGNIRIPNINYLTGYNPEDPYQWIDIPWMDNVQNYASLIGDRIDGLNRNFTGNTTFTLTSSFQSLNCSDWTKMTQDEAENWSMSDLGKNLSTALLMDTPGGSFQTFLLTSTDHGSAPLTDMDDNYHPKLIFGTTGEETFFSTTSCAASTTYVEARVSCISKGTLGKAACGVQSIRKLNAPLLAPEINLMESLRVTYPDSNITLDPFMFTRFFGAFMTLLGDAQVGSGTSGIEEFYMEDPNSAFNTTFNPETKSYAELSNLDINVVEKRLALLYNTLWKASWSYKSAIGGEMGSTRLSYDPLLNTTSTTVFPLQPVYSLNLPWIILYFVSVAIMFFAAGSSLIMHTLCRAPPFLGYVSSLTKDSVFFQNENTQGNSIEDGPEKAGRLRHMKVMVGDVMGNENVGRVAFAPSRITKRVRKNRWYA